MSELKHWGVLGMKWGVRKDKDRVSKSKKSDDHRESRELKRKSTSSLSNAQLRKLNERLNLEQSYKNLTRRRVTTGEKIVTGVLTNVGKQAVTTFVNAGINYAFNRRRGRTRPGGIGIGS